MNRKFFFMWAMYFLLLCMCFNSNITGDFWFVILYGPEYFGASLAQNFLSAHDNGNSLFSYCRSIVFVVVMPYFGSFSRFRISLPYVICAKTLILLIIR